MAQSARATLKGVLGRWLKLAVKTFHGWRAMRLAAVRLRLAGSSISRSRWNFALPVLIQIAAAKVVVGAVKAGYRCLRML
jgi:hypothetical protein